MSRKNVRSRAVSVDWKVVGRRIRELRGFDMTQADLADRIGVSQGYLSTLEHGQGEIGAEVLLAISREFEGPSSGCLLEKDKCRVVGLHVHHDTKSISLLTLASSVRTLVSEVRYSRRCESCNRVARGLAEGSKLNEFI